MAAAARRASRELGYTRMWSIHPNQIRPILKAFAPGEGEIDAATKIIAAAARADWAPTSFDGTLHDRASYRFFWQILERAHQTGQTLSPEVRLYFDAPAPSSVPPANRETRQGQSRTLRRSQCWAYWSPSRWISLRYRSAQRPEQVRAWSARERRESVEVVRPPLRSASPLSAGCRLIRCHKPGMQATARAHRRPARQHQGAGCVALAPSQASSIGQQGWHAE